MSAREVDVFSLMILGLKREAIMLTLGVYRCTVNHHIKSIFDKIGVSSQLEVVIWAHAKGMF